MPTAIPKAARSTFQELLAGVDPALASIARKLRLLILTVDPKAVETVRLGDNAATYGIGPKKMTEGYAYIMPLREYVNLGFYQGARLKDPKGLLAGTGKGLRHVKVRHSKDTGSAALRDLVREACALRRGES